MAQNARFGPKMTFGQCLIISEQNRSPSWQNGTGKGWMHAEFTTPSPDVKQSWLSIAIEEHSDISRHGKAVFVTFEENGARMLYEMLKRKFEP